MSDLKFYKSPFHVTHEEDVADNMCESIDRELHEAKSKLNDRASLRDNPDIISIPLPKDQDNI